MANLKIILPRPHPQQRRFISSPAPRKMVRAGRRGGKTVGMAIDSVQDFLQGSRILYAGPTEDQTGTYWKTVKRILEPAIEQGLYYKNENLKIIELAGTEQRIRAKTAWNADTLRGDYADKLILDEFQLMNESAWDEVGAPMLLDTNGEAIFIYTPPSLRSRSASKARDPQHAAKMFRKYAAEAFRDRWATFHFSSMENPHISKEALATIAEDMTALAYRQEILAEDVDEAPGALWKRDDIVIRTAPTDLSRVVIGVDPSASSDGNEAGIIAAGRYGNGRTAQFHALEDRSLQGSPLTWASEAIAAYHFWHADAIVAEKNNGGEMVSTVINQIDPNVPVILVWASRGKATRAEPVSAIYEQRRATHHQPLYALEDELCLWIPGDPSPNRLDALVWAATDLMLGEQYDKVETGPNPFYGHASTS